jgi:hypothetical protein
MGAPRDLELHGDGPKDRLADVFDGVDRRHGEFGEVDFADAVVDRSLRAIGELHDRAARVDDDPEVVERVCVEWRSFARLDPNFPDSNVVVLEPELGADVRVPGSVGQLAIEVGDVELADRNYFLVILRIVLAHVALRYRAFGAFASPSKTGRMVVVADLLRFGGNPT